RKVGAALRRGTHACRQASTLFRSSDPHRRVLAAPTVFPAPALLVRNDLLGTRVRNEAERAEPSLFSIFPTNQLNAGPALIHSFASPEIVIRGHVKEYLLCPCTSVKR